jgi:hypothetical protein
MGLFRTFIVMRMKGVRSLREMTRLLDTDLRLRRLCLIKPAEKGYSRSVLSRFIRKVGETRLINIIEEKVVKLLERNGARDIDSIFDASFIKAWSTRDPLDSQTGYSDREARVGRAGRSFGLGYKLHLAIDSKTAFFGLHFCFGQPERAETLPQYVGEDEVDSQTVCSQIEKRDSRQPVQ